MAQLLQAKRTAHIGTYKVVPKVNWQTLNAANFCIEGGKEVDWLALYPIKEARQVAEGEEPELSTKIGNFSPRQACKLFYDGLYIIEQAEKNPKTLLDRLPEMAHKAWKRKQFQKQMMESCRRVCCRVVKGLGFSPNCVAEDIFMIILLDATFALGWRRIESHLVGLPECKDDRDFTQIKKKETSAEHDMLWRQGEAVVVPKKTGKSTAPSRASLQDTNEPKNWFRGYSDDADHLLDHHLTVDINIVKELNMIDQLVDVMPDTYEDLVNVAQDSPCAIVVTEAKSPFRVTHVNKAFEATTGFTAQDAIGKDLNVVQGHNIEELKKLEAAKDHRIELLNTSKDGKTFKNHMRVKPINSRQQQGGFMLGVLHRSDRVS